MISMRFLASVIATICLAASTAQAEGTKIQEDLQMVAPALEKYTQGMLLGEVWKRPGLSARDRSAVTLAMTLCSGREAVDYANGCPC